MNESLQAMSALLALRIYLSDVAGIKGRGRGSGNCHTVEAPTRHLIVQVQSMNHNS